MKQDRSTAKAQRNQIAAMLNQGMGIREISRSLPCSTRTVQKVKARMEDPDTAPDFDMRDLNGRPEQFTTETRNAIYAMREQMNLGARLLHSLLLRDPEKYGIFDRNQIPTHSTIHKWLVEAHMTKKMVGKQDKRGFPIDFEDKPGVIALDEWGPWNIRGERMFLVTCQDRYTKLTFGVPVLKKGSGDNWILRYRIGT